MTQQYNQEVLKKQLLNQEILMKKLTEKYKNEPIKLKFDPEFQELIKVIFNMKL